MTNETVLKLIEECDGWSILDPSGLRQIGLPATWADDLTQCFESDFSRGTSTIHVSGRPTNQLSGIRDLDLLHRLAKHVNANLDGVKAIGRGTRAEQLKDAICAAL